MNKEESLRLYTQGKENWNLWANRMLARREDSEVWKDEAEVDFTSHVFEEVDFSGFVFPGNTRFNETAFKGRAGFEKSTFKGPVGFREATFEGDAIFGETTFKGGAGFGEATFEGDVWFNEATFEGDAIFREATFKGGAGFGETTFEGHVWFNEATFKGYAGFDKATFKGEAGFREATFKGHVWFGEAAFEEYAGFDKATFKGEAGFGEVTFEKYAGFGEATFEGDAIFREATFKGHTGFGEATFEGEAGFREATFEGEAGFREATFKGRAGFREATFKGHAGFEEVTFEGDAMFWLSTFEHPAIFYNAAFRADAGFQAVQGSSVFTMTDAEFLDVPDFQQATFVESPRLDNAQIGPQLSRWDKLKEFFTKGDSEKEGRWRALKRLATQGHDHAREQLFFRGELLARRGAADRYWHASFWLGVFYQIFSDFGRSLIRPLLWWAAGMLVFACIYLSHYSGGSEWWLLECAKGTGRPWVAALGLSVHKSLPAVSGFGFGDKIQQFHACLYGVESENPFRPIIPDQVAFLGVLQVLFSAVMIFLFLLAVRNHFRIK